ncbi:hypothetical protein BCY90_15780 [Agrobacterium deltaense]|nr:zeta toxin family protein [Agrobacterium sp. D14]RKF41772.1 hypothetical protein BCY90_15780 [Agrobacterium deltaense]
MTLAERPRLIVLGGQPGAGKTDVLIASHAELEQSGSAIGIAGDDLRSFHPGSGDCLAVHASGRWAMGGKTAGGGDRAQGEHRLRDDDAHPPKTSLVS